MNLRSTDPVDLYILGCANMNVFCKHGAAMALMGVASTACGDEEAVVQRLGVALSHVTVKRISETPVDGIFEVEVAQNDALLYVVDGGKYLFSGDMYDLSREEIVNLSEERREGRRRSLLETINRDQTIAYRAISGHGPRIVIFVFTDVDCPYCREFHQNVVELNQLGVEVRYLAYPRAGVASPSYKKMVAAWCADDPNRALNELKSGGSISPTTCEHPIDSQFALANRLGIEGTPTIISEQGTLIRGYVTPEELIDEFKVRENP